ncbi:LamG-like jellyroll fold domain-containing protein [Halorussus sp. MSC15.2]|uniref:LamG domain-containing protein n=1 Tax=Halorussus sp. MSC15.2 TaxID=2283638 RepID=UPI0013D8BCE2|nr:LamG-like jellyroll fold domain-containing protein [Halorussus sp. MSC15.2]NEU58599.1 LamG domain-containing protein [Halorussus sp. MSC15.2]
MTLVTQWTFDGDLRDRSGYDHHLSGSVTYAEGKTGRALVSAGNALDVPMTSEIEGVFSGNELTVAARLRIDESSKQWNDVLRYDDETGQERRLERGDADANTGRADYCNNVGFADTTTKLSDHNVGPAGEWYSLVVRRLPDRVEVWIDGTKVDAGSVSGSIPTISGGLRIDEEDNDTRIDEIRLYDHAVSTAEIQRFARGAVGRWKCSDLVEPIDNIYDSENLGSQWTIVTHGNGTATLSATDDDTAPSAPESTTKLVAEKETTGDDPDTSGGDKVWHGDYKKGADSVTASAGDTFTFSGWYRLTDSTGDPRNLRCDLYATDESWNNYSTDGTVRLEADSTWHRFENTVELTEDKEVTPSWQWSYDYGYQKLELCGLQVQYATAPSDEFVQGKGSRPGTAPDSTGHGHDGDPTGVAQAEGSALGRTCASFDGHDDEIVLPSLGVSGDRSLTLTAWLRVDADAGTNNNVFGFGGRNGGDTFSLRTDGDGAFKFYFWDDDLVATTSNYYGSWVHVAARYDADAGERTVFVDGQQVASDAPATPNFVDADYSIGGFNGEAFDGMLADVRLYATALSTDEIRHVHENRARLDHNGTLHAHEFVEFDERLMVEDETFTCDQHDRSALGTVTPRDTDASDWEEGDDTLGNIAIVGEAEITDTTYVPASFEYTKVNDDEGFTTSWSGGVVSPEGWQTGWNEFYVPVSDADYLSPASAPWENMDRLQLYRTGPNAGDSNQTIRLRDLRLVKTPDAADSGALAVDADGVVTAVEFDETTALSGSTVAEDAPTRLSVGRLDEC